MSKNGTCHSHIETTEENWLTLSWTVCRIFPVNPFSWPSVCFRVSSELSWLNSIASRPSSTVVNDPDNGARNSTQEIEWYLLGWEMLAIRVLHEKWKLLTSFQQHLLLNALRFKILKQKNTNVETSPQQKTKNDFSSFASKWSKFPLVHLCSLANDSKAFLN